MRKIFYLLLAFTLFSTGMQSQNCDDVTATAVSTPSTCQSNGSITINFSGASADKLVGQQYSLRSTTGSLAVGPVNTNVFNNLPPGNYNLEASAFCNSLAGVPIVRTVNNITVGGSYQEPRLSFVAPATTSTAAIPTSRNSYVGCSTGLIAVLLEYGNQTTMPTFTITSAPVGVTVPQTVAATKATTGSATAGWRYMLDGTWPAGTYTVSANDGCYSAALSLKINEITTVPTGSARSFYTYGDGTDCSKAYYEPYYSYSSNPDFYRYFNDGLYEYGIAPIGEIPKEGNWFPVRYFLGSTTTVRDLIDLSPGKVSDYYTPNLLAAYTRVKNCPSAITSIPVYNFFNPDFTFTNDICTGTRTYVFAYPKSSSPQVHTFCYPLTITVTDQATGETKYSNSNYLYTDPNFSWDCKSGEKQYLNITDASGYKIKTNYEMIGGTPSAGRPVFSLNQIYNYYNYNNCDSYKRTYSTTRGTPCNGQNPFPCYVTITDNVGNVIKLDTLTSILDKSFDNFEYGVRYTFTYLYPNWDNYTSSTTMMLDRADYVASSYKFYKVSSSQCLNNVGILRVEADKSGKNFKAGTTITITGPTGYIGQSRTYITNENGSNGSFYNFPQTELPAGEYTATIVSCGETYTIKANIAQGYVAEKIDYTLEQDCMGPKLFPSGSISLGGVAQPTVYFRMISAPVASGTTNKVIASTSNDYFSLTTAGTYIMGMMVSNSLTGCAMSLDTIVHNPQPLALDRDKTSAYSCPGGSTGYLTLQAANGVLPYTYSVYDKTNTTQLVAPITSSTAIDLNNFGEANETYTIRMSDACGNSFNQQVTLVSLDRTALAYGQELLCDSSTISIFGFTVTNATYSWTGPNGFTSTLKNPVIPDATDINSGWYKVDITSQACGITVKDSIFITVYKPVVSEDVNGKIQEVTLCPYQALAIGQDATGGSGKYSYQWAYNTNTLGTGTWTNLAGQTKSILTATSSAYIFTSTIAEPTIRYYRLTVTDADCGTYYLYYHTNVKVCMLLVNPDLKSPASL